MDMPMTMKLKLANLEIFFQASVFEKWRSNMGRHFHRTYLKDNLLPFEF